MLRTKPDVRFGVITLALVDILLVLEELSAFPGAPKEGIWITSGTDGKHMKGSKHYTGEAVDIRSKTFPRKELPAWIAALKEHLGPDYDVILEDKGTPNEHIHIEYDPK